MEDTSITHFLISDSSPRLTREERAAWRAAPGALAGEYLLQAVVGTGGHGTVYQAEHRILRHRAAVKVLHSHLNDKDEMLQRFVREAQLINRIRHPNIVGIYDFGVLPDGSPYYVMELLPSRTLNQVLQEQIRLSPDRALEFLAPICAALEAAHRAGVVHRDLKASNVAVVSDAHPPQVKLLDFGIAKILHPEPGEPGITTDGERLGTPHAMAPEQIRGGVIGPATDIYALGALLFRLLTGDHPFSSANPLEIERMHLEAPVPRPSARAPVPTTVDAVVQRCMDKESDRRYPSASALLAALREALAPPSSPAPSHHRSAPAFVIHAEATLPLGNDDDDAYTTVSNVLDSLEQELCEKGFILAEQMGMALLGVRLLDASPSLKPEELLAFARELHQRAQARVADSRASVHLCVHLGQVDTRQGPGGIEITGGPLTDTAGWIVRDASGFAMTPETQRACIP
ncbi:serine/threonine-protein kinase [Hyalangium versicolor]|uniref:serine/threonine-protein kinase n=1 Tax=Hyalangium versicolor TaxID=2861190 RepID=UPI001CCED42A|nr:serine/threonine-protein kinase [Hyalangium versicolor]